MTREPAVEEQDVVPYWPDAALASAARHRAAGPALAGWVLFTGWLWLTWTGPTAPAVAVSAVAALFLLLPLLRPDPERRGGVPTARGPWVTRVEDVPDVRLEDVATHVAYVVQAVVLAVVLCATCLWADQQADVGSRSAVGVASSAGGAMAVFGLLQLVRLLRLPTRDLRSSPSRSRRTGRPVAGGCCSAATPSRGRRSVAACSPRRSPGTSSSPICAPGGPTC